MSDEIIVTGRRTLPDWLLQSTLPKDPGAAEAAALAGLAFVSPGAPKPVEEIIVKAKRTTRGVRTIRTARQAGTPWGAIAATLGWLTSKVLEEVSQQQLDRAFAELESITGRVKPDSPLEVQPQPKEKKPIDEIIVTARRRSRTFELVTGGLPMIPAPEVPFEPPRRPRRRPAREPRPPGRPRRPSPRRPGRPAPRRQPLPRAPDIQPAQPPTVPEFEPATIPRREPARIPGEFPSEFAPPLGNPARRFQPAPGARPGADPFRDLRPSRQPRNQPQRFSAAGRLTRVGSVVLPFEDSQPEANPLAQQARRRCPPCKKKKDERRKKCYKKLVEERAFEKWDNVFKWAEIDCLTGRPV